MASSNRWTTYRGVGLMERFHEIERVSVTARPTGVCRLGGVRTPPTSSPDVNKTMLNRCIIDDAVWFDVRTLAAV